MNNTLHTAGPLAHVRIVVVSLIAAIAVVGVAIASSPRTPDMGSRLEARAPLLKAGQLVIWSGVETSTIR
jgi:hypothetical protein